MASEIKGGRVVVVGGGVVGLAVAREAARRGRDVLVLERGPLPAARASHAAAGMLSPAGESRGPGAFLELARDSLERYPAFARELADATGIDPALRQDGALFVALRRDDVARLHEGLRWKQAAGLDARWMDAEEARRLEPALGPDVLGALRHADDARVDNRALGRALAAAAARDQVRPRTRADVEALLERHGRVTGVRLADGACVAADVVVLAAGAWSAQIGGLPHALPVTPVRGQILALADSGGTVRATVAGNGVYLVPRTEGGRPRVLVGATTEHVGFDVSTTEEAMASLRAGAAGLVPALEGARRVEAWAGLRPGTPDDLPILGWDPELEGLLYCTGHFRNGILLAPATAALTGRLLEGDAPAELAPFSVARFTT